MGEDQLELRRRKWEKRADCGAGTLGDELWPTTVTAQYRGWRRRTGPVEERRGRDWLVGAEKAGGSRTTWRGPNGEEAGRETSCRT